MGEKCETADIDRAPESHQDGPSNSKSVRDRLAGFAPLAVTAFDLDETEDKNRDLHQISSASKQSGHGG